jgi:hypothetical protein
VSDLSRLLGDVYGASTPPAEDADAVEPTTPMAAVPAPADDPPAPPAEDVDADGGPAAPGWADEAVLDEAFADWVPGPPTDAVAEERDMLAGVEPAETVAEEFDIDAWLAPEADTVAAPAVDVDESVEDTRYEAFVPQAEPEPEQDVQGDLHAAWTRNSDDLLPRGRRGRRLSLRR